MENNASSRGDCLYFLDKHTSGQPKELVRSCQHMAPDVGYDEARNLLKQHFGKEHRITAAYMDKALNWPAVKPEDVKSLQAYALFMRECCNVMLDIQCLQELNMPANMKTVILKLPFKLREKWRELACGILEQQHRRAQFTDLEEFIERQVRIVSDPIFGDFHYPQHHSGTGRPVTRVRTMSGVKSQKPCSYAATVTTSDNPTERKVTADAPVTGMRPTDKRAPSQRNNLCSCCSQRHALEQCTKFDRKMHKEKISFVKEKGLCFGCLHSGHIKQRFRSVLFWQGVQTKPTQHSSH